MSDLICMGQISLHNFLQVWEMLIIMLYSSQHLTNDGAGPTNAIFIDQGLKTEKQNPRPK